MGIASEAKVFASDSQFSKYGYDIINTPEMSAQVIESFNSMPRDGHSLKRLRNIRLNQYFAYWEEGQWIYALLPKRKYIQSAEFIRLAEAGGVLRHREQLECDPTPLVTAVLDSLPVVFSESYHINVNQIRVIVNSEFNGVTVPEGPHRDGHLFSVIVVAKRHNVEGGETQVIDPASNEIVRRAVLEENQAVLIDDERYIHYASNITPVEGNDGYRDIWVIEISPWHKRSYGPTHERLALATSSLLKKP